MKAKEEQSSVLKTTYSCPKCGDTGWAIKKKYVPMYGHDVEFAIKCPYCNGGLTKRAESAKQASNIPLTFNDKKYSSFRWDLYRDESGNAVDVEAWKKLVESFLKDYEKWRVRGLGLYISSRTKGSGKTFLASCICNELMETRGIKTRFVRATDLIDISKSADADSIEAYKRDPIKLLCDCDLLVIDDIGQKKTGYDWMNEILFKIIDTRLTEKRSTILTSNIRLNELDIDSRISERINKSCYDIHLPECNVRSREATEEKKEFLRELGLLRGEPPERRV